MKSNKEIISDLCRSGMGRKLSDKENIELKNKLLSCYLDIAKVCEKYHLRVMLGGGSCLGAVRHNGFIPWDDDFDVNMPRKDFEKFKTIFEKELGDKYILNCPNYKGNASNRFAKILIKNTKFIELGMDEHDGYGMIKIDLFTAENIPDNLIIRYIKGLFCNALMLIAGCVHYAKWYKRDKENPVFNTEEYNRIRLFLGRAFSFKSVQFWFDKVDKACQYKKETKYIGFPTGRKHYFGEIHRREDIFPLRKGEFEGYQVYLPNHAEKYLSELYGEDFMKIPQEGKRERHFIVDIQFDTH